MILTILVTVSTVSICIGLVKLGLIYLDSYRKLLRSNCFRGPRALPLVGNSHLFMGTTADIYQKLRELTAKYQSPFRLWLGPRVCFVLHDAEHIKRLLLHPNALEKSLYFDMLKPVLRQGLITVQVSKWKPHRKAIEPLFSKTVLESFVPKMRRHALLAVEKMGMEDPGSEFDINHYMSRYVFDTIADTSMGIQLNSLTAKDCVFFDTCTSTLDTVITRITKPWLHPDFIFAFTSLGQTFWKNVEYIHKFAKNVICDTDPIFDAISCCALRGDGAERVTGSEEVRLVAFKVLDNAKSDIVKQIKSQPRESLLGLLLTSVGDNYKFSDEEIFDEIITVIGAGFETSASLLNVAIFILAKYPNIQDKVYAEVRENYGESNFERLDITLQTIDRMEYLNRFIKETLRLFPTAPTVFRYLSGEVNIGEYTFPAASCVMIDFIQNHRNEKYWPKPLEFNPDRFLPNHPLGSRHPYAYTPFSAGPRNCIGRKFALLSVKILLVILTSRYIIKTKIAQEVMDLELKMCVTLKTKDPIMISIERRLPENS